MTDVSHELGALRFVVDSPLSSKVAMFNNQATQHKQSQLLNPFSHDGRAASPKPTFSKDQYGKPLAGSLTEMRGQKANMHVMKEMLELCQIIDSEGYQVKDEPTMRVIPFGELFNIYNYISDKVVGILLRARKHKLLEFEGEMLYQRRDDDVPIFLLRPIVDIRHELNAKIEEIKRGASPAPQSTSVLLDRTAQDQKLKVDAEQRLSKSRTPSPSAKSKSKSKSPSPSPMAASAAAAAAAGKPEEPTIDLVTAAQPTEATTTTTNDAPATVPAPAVAAPVVVVEQPPAGEAAPTPVPTPEPANLVQAETVPAPTQEVAPADVTTTAPATTADAATPAAAPPAEEAPVQVDDVTVTVAEAKAEAEADAIPAEVSAPVEVSNELPTIVIEASATFVRTVSVEKLPEKEEMPAQAQPNQVETAPAAPAESG